MEKRLQQILARSRLGNKIHGQTGGQPEPPNLNVIILGIRLARGLHVPVRQVLPEERDAGGIGDPRPRPRAQSDRGQAYGERIHSGGKMIGPNQVLTRVKLRSVFR